jgi:hypothetical protein
MRRRSSSLPAVAAAAVALVLAGCGNGSSSGHSVPKDPKGELAASVTNLGESDTLGATVKLEIPPAALQQLARTQGERLTAQDAAAISAAQLVIEAKTTNGKNLADLKSGDQNATAVAIRAIDNGHTYLEMRVLSGDLYLQGDVKGFLGLIHQAKAYEEVKARAASLPDFVKALVAGKWVSLNGAAAQGLASQFGVQTGEQSGSKQSQTSKMINDLKSLLNKDVSVTRVGSDDKGDHLRLSGNAKTLVNDTYQSFSSAVPGGAALSQAKPQKVPSQVVTVDAWVKDGVLSEISIDMSQFLDKKDSASGQPLPVTLTFTQEGDDITKPSDVTPIDLTQLGALFGALAGGSSG